MTPGYWATHTYTRRAVIDLDKKSFCGWNTIQRLANAAHQPERYNPTDQPHLAQRDQALIHYTFKLGGRIGETVQLQKPMIQFKEDWVYCTRVPVLKRWRYVGTQKSATKSVPDTRDFVFPATEPFTAEMQTWHSQADGYLFPSVKGHISGTRAYQIVTDLAKRARFNCWPHRLRSERASQLASEYGWKTDDLMRFFGWLDAKTAMLYAHQSIEDMKKRF